MPVVEPLYDIPVTHTAAVAFVLLNVCIIFLETSLPSVADELSLHNPITDDAEPVPTFGATQNKFVIVFPVTTDAPDCA
ncbi:MAG: hypothetical protein IPG09_08700 [Ignavibacteria bacterium]|nr:hypothetical protein [Ignavibacteria bacterium]